MSLIVADNRADWNNFATKNGGNFLHSWEWGEFQEATGKKIYRYRVTAAENLTDQKVVGQFLLVEHPLPLGQKYFYCPFGPVLLEGNFKTKIFGDCLASIREIAKKFDATFVRLDPLTADPTLDMRQFGFVPTKHVQPQHTVVMNLTKDEPALLAAMKPKTRYNLRLAQKHGVVVREADYSSDLHSALEDFWKLMVETTERDRFRAHARGYYKKMLATLNPTHKKNLCVRLFFATYHDQPVATALISEFGDTATYLHGASSVQHKEVMAPYLLHWSIIQEARSRGLAKYDFWGVAPEGAGGEHSWYGVTRFKMGFGGERKSYIGTWDLPQKRFFYVAYQWLRRLIFLLVRLKFGRIMHP